MGRKSKLSEKQWREIELRMLDGETGGSLAKEYGLTYNAIKQRLGAQVNQTKYVANQIIATERALDALPISAQINAVNLSARLRSTSEHLVSAAEYGAMTAHRLSMLANAEVQKVDDANPMESIESLKGIAALIELTNKAGSLGVSLLAANKDMMKGNPDGENGQVKPRTRDEFYGSDA